MIKTIARALSLGLLLFLVPANAEARRHHDQSLPVFDRHAIHSVGSEALIGERSLRVRHRASRSHHRARSAHRQHPHRHARKDQSRVAAAPPIPGTLGAYRKVIETEAMSGGEIVKTASLGNIGGLQDHFLAKLKAIRAAMPSGLGFNVGSGYRSYAEQARLHRLKPRLAARPGHSNHERGLAGDLRFASRESARWLHRNSSKYGLRFPMSYEPWHIEPVGATRFAIKHRRHRYASAG